MDTKITDEKIQPAVSQQTHQNIQPQLQRQWANRWWMMYRPQEIERSFIDKFKFVGLIGLTLTLTLFILIWFLGITDLKQNKYVGPPMLEIMAALATKRGMIYTWQIWRPYTSLFLTRGFVPFMIYLADIVIICSQLEVELEIMLPIIYLVCGICGNIMSSLVSWVKYIVEPAPSLMGLNGAIPAEIMFNERNNEFISWVVFVISVIMSFWNGRFNHSELFPIIGCHLIGFFLAIYYRVQLQESHYVTIRMFGKEAQVERRIVLAIAKFVLQMMLVSGLVVVITLQIVKPPRQST